VSPAGAAAVAHRPAIEVDGFEFAEGRRWMTNEALAAIEGARRAGASHFVLADAHGGGLGLLLDELPPDAEVIRSWPRPLGQMEGISTGGIEACLLVGHRTGSQSWSGVLSQSFSQAGIRDVRLAGQSRSETGFNALVAQQFGVPIVLASGDDAYVSHVQKILPGVHTVITKQAISLSSADHRMPFWTRSGKLRIRRSRTDLHWRQHDICRRIWRSSSWSADLPSFWLCFPMCAALAPSRSSCRQPTWSRPATG
jgi:D-amino peptidase